MNAPDFERLFSAIPANYLALDLDWNIVAMTDAGLNGRSREDVIGKNQFEVFPDNPDDPDATGSATMLAALKRVLAENAGHSMAVTRYDVADSTGAFREYYWKPVNQPGFDDNGEISHIIHGVEDVTDAVLASGSSA